MTFLVKKLIFGGGECRVFHLFFFSGCFVYGKMCWKHQGLPQTRKSEFGRIYWKGKLGRKADGTNLISEGWERREVLLEQLG